MYNQVVKVFGTDYDGVIINIEPQKAQAFGGLLNKRWGIDKDEAKNFWMATGGTSRKYKFDYFYQKRFRKKLPDEKYRAIETDYSRLLKEEFYPHLKLLPEALDLLKFVCSNFDHTFVSSGIPMGEIQYLISLNGLDTYFDLILGTNKQFPSKREHFKEIQSRWNPDLLVFVADSPEDMKIAKDASAIPLGVLTNYTEKELTHAGAIKVCRIEDAISTIKKLI